MPDNQTPKPTASVKLLKQLLAEFLGIEVDDIQESDRFIEDFNMGATELTDFMERLNENRFDTTKIDMTEITTLGELIEAFGLEWS